MVRIRIRWEGGAASGALDDTSTSRLLADALPWTAEARVWGGEVYFDAPVHAELDAAPRVVVDPGTICFWVQGACLAVPYGPTPISERGECRLVTAANVIGRIEGDPAALAAIPEGAALRIERADD